MGNQIPKRRKTRNKIIKNKKKTKRIRKKKMLKKKKIKRRKRKKQVIRKRRIKNYSRNQLILNVKENPKFTHGSKIEDIGNVKLATREKFALTSATITLANKPLSFAKMELGVIPDGHTKNVLY